MIRSRSLLSSSSVACGVFLIVSCLALFASCSSAPSRTSGSSSLQISKYGAGSADDTGRPANKAGAPGALQKVRTEEILAQVTMHEADMAQEIAARKFASAISSFDSIADLIPAVPAGLARLNEDRAKLQAALDTIRFEAVSVPSETTDGVAFKKSFAVRVYTLDADGDDKKPLSGLECTVSCPAGSENRNTGDDGVISYTAPVPSKPGKNILSISSNLTSRDSTLRDSISLMKEKGLLAVSFPHVVFTKARQYATTISILDINANGNPLQSNISATTLLKPLVQKGFRRIGMADFTTQLAAGDDAATLKAAKNLFRGGVERFIYGTVRIDGLAQGADGLWSCSAVGKISVHDFTKDVNVYSTTLTVQASAKTADGAIEIAREKLAGEMLPLDLYYNM
jgi:hypothetical protein